MVCLFDILMLLITGCDCPSEKESVATDIITVTYCLRQIYTTSSYIVRIQVIPSFDARCQSGIYITELAIA